MLLPWRQRRNPRDEEEMLGLHDVAPIPAGPLVGYTLSPNPWNSLHGAASLGYRNIVVRLLVDGYSPNLRDDFGRTPLMYAIEHDRRDVLCMLLNCDADVNAADDAGHSPLLLALYLGRQWMVDRLMTDGARVGFAEAVLQSDAQRAGHLPTNVNLDAPILGKKSLLCYTAGAGEFSLTHLLLSRGANPNGRDGTGIVPLDAAADASRGRIIRLLLDWGANPAEANAADAPNLLAWAGIKIPSADNSAEGV